jgi:ABC-type transport system substrate-binding protein
MAAKYREARRTTDPDDRREIFGEIFSTISRDQPVNFLLVANDYGGYQDYVVGPEKGEGVFGANWDSLQTWTFAEP